MLPGISWSHLILFAVIALLVIGPKDLPRAMRSFGRFVGKARAMAREFQDSFEEIAREAELEEMRNEAAKLRAGMNANLNTGPAIPLTPAEEENLIAAHNAKVLEAEAAAMSQSQASNVMTPLPAGTAVADAAPVSVDAVPPSDNVTPIRGARR